jgi:hypothetical protein
VAKQAIADVDSIIFNLQGEREGGKGVFDIYVLGASLYDITFGDSQCDVIDILITSFQP